MPSRERRTTKWSVEDKVRILTETKDLSGRALADYLEREGVILAQVEQWRLAVEEEGVSPKAVAKRVRALERELARKEKVLAEAAVAPSGSLPFNALTPAEEAQVTQVLTSSRFGGLSPKQIE